MAAKHPGLFTDLDKKARDFLSKDFPDKQKLEIKTRRVGWSFEGNFARNQDGSVFGSLNPKYNLGFRGVSLGGLIDTKKTIKAEIVGEESFPGFKGSVSGFADESVTLEGEYKHPYLTVGAALNLFSAKGNKITASTVFGYEGVALGLQAEHLYDKFQNFHGIASYSNSNLVASLYARVNTNTPASVVGFNYHQRLSNNLSTIAADVNYDVNKPDVPKISIGGSYDIVDSRSDKPIIVKGKVDTEGLISISYAQQLSKYVRLILGANFNTNNLSASGNHTFGITLNVNDEVK